MNPIERVARRIDRAQQGFGPAAFVFGVIKKFGDDRAGSLAALIAYYGFLSLFPLLLLLFTVLGIVAGHDQAFAKSVQQSALSQFPVVGKDLGKSIRTLHRNSAPGLIVGILGLVWGAQGAIQAGQYAMAEVWNVPGVVRPSFWARLVRTLLMMGVLGVFLVLSTTAAGFAGFASFASGWPAVAQAGGVVLSLVLNVLLYVVAFRVLTPKQIGHRGLLPGAVLGGLGWTVLQYLGTLVVDHTLRDTSQIYGFFAIVLGLVAWIYLGAEMTLYVAEVNVVRARHLWPRGMVQPPLTEADRRVLAAIAEQGERRPEQHVSVRFHHEPPDGEGTTTAGPPDRQTGAVPGSGPGPAEERRTPMFNDVEIAYLRSQPLARLATVGTDGQPDNSPVGFEFDGECFWIGGFDVTATRKYKNVVAGGRKVALTIDDLESVEPWRPRGIRVYGTAEAVERQGQFGQATYLKITPTISWSWALEVPFGGEGDGGGAGGMSRTRTVWTTTT